MKSFLYILLILIIFTLGISIGNSDDTNKAENVKDKIEIFEENIIVNNNTESYNIEPNIFNKIANKCNKGIDKIIDKILDSLVN